MNNPIDRSDFVGLKKDVEFNTQLMKDNKNRLARKANKDDVKDDMSDICDKLDSKASQSDVSLLQKIVFTTVAAILAAFLTAVIQLVI